MGVSWMSYCANNILVFRWKDQLCMAPKHEKSLHISVDEEESWISTAPSW